MDLLFHGDHDDDMLYVNRREYSDGLGACIRRPGALGGGGDVLSTSPSSAGDSGFDTSSFETTFTDPNATLTNEEDDDSAGASQVNPAYFNQLYEALTYFDENAFDGVDSPKRLYNRKPSPQYDKTPEELAREQLVKTSKLSTAAPEFVPKAKPTPVVKEDDDPGMDDFVLDFQKLMTALNNNNTTTTNNNTTTTNNNNSTSPTTQVCNATSTPLRIRQQRHPNVPVMVCLFCQRFGFGRAVFTSHSLRNPVTKEIICPNLKDNVCITCGPSDEDWLLHTTELCLHRRRIPHHNNGFINFN